MTDLILLAATVGALDAPASMALGSGARGHRDVRTRGARELPERRRGARVDAGPAGGAAPAGGRALVVMLHGCAQDAGNVARGTRLHETRGRRRDGWCCTRSNR